MDKPNIRVASRKSTSLFNRPLVKDELFHCSIGRQSTKKIIKVCQYMKVPLQELINLRRV